MAESRPEGMAGMLRDIGSALGELFGGGRLDEVQRMRIEVAFGLMGHVAKADGIFTSHESAFVNALMDELDLPLQGRELATRAFDDGRFKRIDAAALIERFQREYPKGSAETDRLFDTLLRLAVSDERIYARERVVLEQLSDALGYTRAELDRRLAVAQAAHGA